MFGVEEAMLHHLVITGARTSRRRDAWLRLGLSLEADRRFADAAKTYRQLLQLKPSDAEAYGSLAQVLLSLGKTGEAGSALRSATSLQHGPGALVH